MNKKILKKIGFFPIAMILGFFCTGYAFAQCGLPGTPPCPAATKKTPQKQKNITPKVTVSKPKPQAKFVPRAPEIEMVKIPAGSYFMGSVDGYTDEKPVHRVYISQSFYVGKYEITQLQWRSVMGKNPSYIRNCGDNCPVESVSWNDAQEFIRKLNALQKEYIYRLPTEAEWEYACRAGTTGDRYGESDSIGWYTNNSGTKRIHPVGQKLPNNFGLFDMNGNVAEWCLDYYVEYSNQTLTDPVAQTATPFRLTRGGGWVDGEEGMRSSHRQSRAPSLRYSAIGFRVVGNSNS